MATYKHIRSSTANKRPTTAIADGQIAINTNTASPGLFFKDSAGTGIVKVGPVHVGTTAPNSSPAAGGSTGNYTGEQWLDTSLTPAQLKVWNGSAWVGVVADELPVSKLQDGQARQLLQTDAAGTGVEWTSNVDVPGTLDVTGATTLDSTLTVPLGSAAAPTVRFTGDTNTGIYSPGADQLALSTNGTGRLFVDSNGRVGVGLSGPSGNLHVQGATGDACRVYITDGDATGTSNSLLISKSGNSSSFTDRSATGYLNFGTADTERLRITSAGLVGVGTTNPAEALEVAGNAILDASNANLKIKAGAGGTTGAVNFTFNTDSTVYGGLDLNYDNRATDGVRLFAAASNYPVTIESHSGAHIAFRGSTTERARIDSSGRLLVGASSANTTHYASIGKVFIEGTGDGSSSLVQTCWNAIDTAQAWHILAKSGGASVGTRGIVASGEFLGTVSFEGDDGTNFIRAAQIRTDVDGTPGTNSMPGRLVFFTTPDGSATPVERMRIKSSGIINFSNAPVYADNTAALAGGLVAGDVYRKSDGTLMITY